MNPKILCVEGKYVGTPSFNDALRKKGYEVKRVFTGKEALVSLAENHPHIAIVNAPSMRTTGVRICQAIRAKDSHISIILICKEGSLTSHKDVDVNVVLVLPFTIRKLENRIKSLLPIQSDSTLRAGPILLDKERLLVRVRGKETRLTPKMASLLEILMKSPGVALERDMLFREVWETDFTDDTRTLDVHISWIRKAIEVDPRRPKYLKTLRGLGYRLDVG